MREILIDDYDAASQVAPKSLCAYMELGGWRKTESFGDLGRVYSFNGTKKQLFVPTSRRLADYELRMWEAAAKIADMEKRGIRELLADLLLDDVDTVRIGTAGDVPMPLETSIKVIQNSRDMMLSAACAALRPSRAFDADASKKARAYLDTVRLGHSDPCSFAINLLSPVPTESHTGLTPEPSPRKTVHKLVSALKATRTAADKAAPEFSIEPFESGVTAGVSANMCAALGGMLRAARGSDIEISVAWALSRANPPKPARINFAQPDAPILEKAARTLA